MPDDGVATSAGPTLSAGSQPTSDPHTNNKRPSRRSILVHAALALLPAILGVYVPHFAAHGGDGTGFIAQDMPYYLANGREIFERGNGIAYPNPFDADPNAPVIYFHWLMWLCGFGIKVLHLDPTFVFLGLGLIFGIVCAVVTRLIVATLWPESRFQVLLFYLTMWGGGLICVSQAAVNVLKGRDPLLLLFRLDPAHGWWFLNWGRNLVYPTEATYHAVVAAAWLAVLQRRWLLAAAMTALVAATHPWTGLELLITMSAWWGLRLILQPGQESFKFAGLTALTAVCFLAYYFVFLESYPSHARLSSLWSLDWSLSNRTILVAYVPVLVLAALRLWRDRRSLSYKEGFLVVCFLAAASLALHDRVFPPVQPVHFTRGYVWTPLFLIALPLVGSTIGWLRRRCGGPLFLLTTAVFVLLTVSDNLAFLVREASIAGEQGFTLTSAERDAFREIAAAGRTGVVACEDNDLCYLSATYTGLIPYHGHPYVSPDAVTHERQVEAWIEGTDNGPWIDHIDYLLLGRNTRSPFMDPAEWRLVHSNEELAFWENVARR